MRRFPQIILKVERRRGLFEETENCCVADFKLLISQCSIDVIDVVLLMVQFYRFFATRHFAGRIIFIEIH